MVIFQFAGWGCPPLSHSLATKNLMFRNVNEIPTEQKKYISVVSKTLSQIQSTPWDALGVSIQCTILSAHN